LPPSIFGLKLKNFC